MTSLAIRVWLPLARFTPALRIIAASPGGQALIGRGFPPNLPLEMAKQIRKNQSKGMPKYDAQETVDQLRALLKRLKISDHEIIRPRSDQSDVNYGVWVRFSKPQ